MAKNIFLESSSLPMYSIWLSLVKLTSFTIILLCASLNGENVCPIWQSFKPCLKCAAFTLTFISFALTIQEMKARCKCQSAPESCFWKQKKVFVILAHSLHCLPEIIGTFFVLPSWRGKENEGKRGHVLTTVFQRSRIKWLDKALSQSLTHLSF